MAASSITAAICQIPVRLAGGFCTRKAAFDRDLRTVLPKKTVLVVDDLRRLNESNKG